MNIRSSIRSTVSAAAFLLAAVGLYAADEQGIFELRVGGSPGRTIVALVRDDGEVLIPLRELVSLAELTLRLDDRFVYIGGDPMRGDVRIPIEEVVRSGDALFAARAVLSERLRVTAEIDQSDLVIVVRGTPPLPAERGEQEERRALALGVRLRRSDPDLEAVPYRGRSGLGLVEWSVSSSATSEARQASGTIRAGAALFGGELLAEAYGGSGESAIRGFYSRRFPGSRFVDRLEVGDVTSPAMISRPLRGAMITNIPRERRQIFGQARIAPEAALGWEYEIYRGGELVGFSRPGTEDEVLVPLGYGINPIEIRLRGPDGEEITRSLLFGIPPAAVAPGRIEYGFAAGRCIARDCERAAYANARYGLSQQVTAGAGAEWIVEDGNATLQPYAELVLGGGRWTVDMAALGDSYARGTLAYADPYARTARLTGGFRASDVEVASPSATGRRWYVDADTQFPVRVFGGESLRLSARADGAERGARSSWRVAAARFGTTGYTELSYSTGAVGADIVGLTGTFLLPRAATVSYDVRGNPDRLQFVNVAAGWQARNRTGFSAGLRWDAVRSDLQAVAGVTMQLDFARVQAQASAGAADPNLNVFASGTITSARNPEARFLPDPRIGSAGIQGRVFYDLDANGVFSEGDRAAPNVIVRAGAGRVTTDARGWFSSWSVAPYAVARVSLDPASDYEPGWIPSEEAITVRPVPNMLTVVDLPLLVTREVVGQVVADGRALGGVPIEIVNADGSVAASVRTFSDGEFYVPSLRPGTYTVRIPSSALELLGATAEPRPLTITGREESTVVTVAPIELREPRS